MSDEHSISLFLRQGVQVCFAATMYHAQTGSRQARHRDGTIIEESDNRGKKESDIQTFVQNLAAAPNTHVASRAPPRNHGGCATYHEACPQTHENGADMHSVCDHAILCCMPQELGISFSSKQQHTKNGGSAHEPGPNCRLPCAQPLQHCRIVAWPFVGKSPRTPSPRTRCYSFFW